MFFSLAERKSPMFYANEPETADLNWWRCWKISCSFNFICLSFSLYIGINLYQFVFMCLTFFPCSPLISLPLATRERQRERCDRSSWRERKVYLFIYSNVRLHMQNMNYRALAEEAHKSGCSSIARKRDEKYLKHAFCRVANQHDSKHWIT
jgi:hypothetical protein